LQATLLFFQLSRCCFYCRLCLFSSHWSSVPQVESAVDPSHYFVVPLSDPPFTPDQITWSLRRIVPDEGDSHFESNPAFHVSSTPKVVERLSSSL